MKKYIKIICITMVILLLCIFISQNCYGAHSQSTDAAGSSGSSQRNENEEEDENLDPIENPDAYKPESSGSTEKLEEKGNQIIGAIKMAGTIISVIAFMVLGLRYMFGSTADRATYKETMIPYLIGAVMIFTIPNILGIIYDLVKGMEF